MHVLLSRRCEVNGCHNRVRCIEIPFYGGQVKRMCPECVSKAAISLIQTPVVERKKGD